MIKRKTTKLSGRIGRTTISSNQSCKLPMKNLTWHFTVTSQTQAVSYGPLGVFPLSKVRTWNYYDIDTTNHWLFSIVYLDKQCVVDQRYHWLFGYIHRWSTITLVLPSKHTTEDVWTMISKKTSVFLLTQNEGDFPQNSTSVSLPLWFPLFLCLSLLMVVQINRVSLQAQTFALKPIVPGTLYKRRPGCFLWSLADVCFLQNALDLAFALVKKFSLFYLMPQSCHGYTMTTITAS